MNRNKFSKVSFDQYKRDNIRELIEEWELEEEYLSLELPKRKTKQAAGYDFHSPFSFELKPGESILIPSGVRAEIESDKYLAIYPRSGLGLKFRAQLDNSVGICDADYFKASNEGHIMIKISNCSFDKSRVLSVKRGEGYAQGIISPYYLTEDDDLDYKITREGGFGSTNKTNA